MLYQYSYKTPPLASQMTSPCRIPVLIYAEMFIEINTTPIE